MACKESQMDYSPVQTNEFSEIFIVNGSNGNKQVIYLRKNDFNKINAIFDLAKHNKRNARKLIKLDSKTRKYVRCKDDEDDNEGVPQDYLEAQLYMELQNDAEEKRRNIDKVYGLISILDDKTDYKIMDLTIQGYTTREISKMLGIAKSTLDDRKQRIISDLRCAYRK